METSVDKCTNLLNFATTTANVSQHLTAEIKWNYFDNCWFWKVKVSSMEAQPYNTMTRKFSATVSP